MSRRVDCVLHDIIMPLAKISDGLPRSTSFLYTVEDLLRCCLYNVKEKYPTLFSDKSALLSTIKRIYKDMRDKHATSLLAAGAEKSEPKTPPA